MDPPSSTWVERLLLNLFSYSLVLVPIAVIVLSTKYRLCPNPIQNSALVQWFVYGHSATSKQSKFKEDGDALLPSDDETEKKSAKSTGSNSTITFIWCFVGLQLSYLIWGVLQEKIMTTKYLVAPNTTHYSNETSKIAGGAVQHNQKHLESSDNFITFHDSQFLVFINRIIAFILSIVALVHNRPKQSQLLSRRSTQQQNKPQAPLYEYIYCSLSNILSSWCQYEALKYVNFPTQVLSKSCKIVPVMLMSRVMLKKKYHFSDYLCALFLSVGMFIFLLNQPVDTTTKKLHSSNLVTNVSSTQNPMVESQQQPSQENQHLIQLEKLSQHMRNSTLVAGLVILALYLAFDSFTSNWQQSLFSRYGVSKWQMMAATNFYSIMLTLTSLHQLGNLRPAFKLLSSSPALLLDCLLMSVMSSVGQLFVYYTIQRFGPVIFTVIMTLRQFLAIFLSCTIYGHTLTMGSSFGLLLVFLVIGFQLWRKSGGSSGKSSGSKAGSTTQQMQIQFKALSK